MLIGVGLDGMVEARNYGAALRKTMQAAGCELPGDATATNGSSIRSAHIDMAGFWGAVSSNKCYTGACLVRT